MALSDLQVFSEYSYSTMTEMLDYNVSLFNEATRGGIILRSAAHQGDYSDQAIWAKLSGLVRRRNAYGTGAVTEKVLTQLLDTSVKVAAGIAPVRIDPSMMKWIQKSPEEAGAVVGKQMAMDSMADQINTALAAYTAGVGAQATNVFDGTAGNATLAVLNTARAKLGDRSEDLACWVIHSKVLFDIYGTALTGTNVLFNFGSVKVTHDGFGNPFIVSDSPSLSYVATGTKYYTCGLVPGAMMVDANNDFIDNIQTINGDENIKRTYQAEWSYNLGLKGFQWDKTNGGKSPSAAALATATNWDKYATSFKDLAGILLKTT
jgi:hypothetical protein